MALISVADAATLAGLSAAHLRRLVASGTLKGRRIGPVWAIDEASLRRYLAKERRPGRKPKRP